jgi:IclR family acetate operon transcriptional repressor
VQSVARAIQMVDLVARSDEGLSAKEISAQTGVNRSATYHLLHTLTQTDVLSRDGRRYLMGPRAGVFAAGVTRHQSPHEHVVARARSLAAATRESVVVTTQTAPGITVLGRTGGVVVASELRRGFSGSAHARASGKLLLALGPEQAAQRILATAPLRPRTANTIVDAKRFERELEEIRERGYAIDNEEFLPGVCCMAGAVDTRGAAVALSIVAPADRFHAQRDRFATELARVTQSGGVAPLTLA